MVATAASADDHAVPASLNIARGLAILGILLSGVFIDGPPMEGFGAAVIDASIGRGAALFYLLAGVVLSRAMGRRAVGTSTATLVRRGALLFGTGLLLLSTVGSLDLLHSFGPLILLAPWILPLRTRNLVFGSAGCFLGGAWAVPTFGSDFYMWSLSRHGLHGEIARWMVETLFGAYGVVIWAGFLMTGIVIGRLDLGSRVIAARMLAGGLLFSVLFTVGVHGINRFVNEDAAARSSVAEQQCRDALRSRGLTDEALGIDGSGRSPSQLPAPCQQMGQRTVSADSFTSLAPAWSTAWSIQTTSVALAVVGFCLLLPAAVRRVLWPVQALGSIALTAYLVQIVLVRDVWMITDNPEGQTTRQLSTPWQLALAGSFVVVLLVMAAAIRRYFKRGPIEWALDYLSGPVAKAPASGG